MMVSEGVHWIITCTPEFERTVAFFRDIIGLSLVEAGVPVTDTQFTRYALLRLPGDGALEIVEPTDESVRALYAAPVVCLHVEDLAEAQRSFEDSGAEFVSPVFRSRDQMAWTYFRAPDGHVYQIWSGGNPVLLSATAQRGDTP